MASDQRDQDEQFELFGRTYELLMAPDKRRSTFLYGAIGAADFAVLYLFFSPGLTGLRLDTGARVLLYLTVTSLGLVILSIALSSLQLRLYQFVAPYIVVAGALCTAVAFELLLAQLDTGAFWFLLPWLVGAAAVIAVPVVRRTLVIWRDNQENFARLSSTAQAAVVAQWRRLFAQ